MSEYLPLIVLGLSTGAVYAIAAMGLTVTYTTSGVFNFAHGAVGMVGAYAFYSLRVDAGLPTWFAIAMAVLVVGPVMGIVIDRVLLRRLHGATPATYVVVSLGLMVALQALAIAVYGASTRPVEPFLSQATFRLPGVTVGYDQATLVVIALVAGATLAWFFRFTRLGIQTRAVVDDPSLTELNALDSGRITTFSWMLGCSFACVSGVLLVPVVGLDAVTLTLLALQVFGAAVIGRLTSLPLTYLGALIIGLGQALSTKWVAGHPSLAGIPTSFPFIVLFAILVFSPKGRFSEALRTERLHVGRRRVASGSFPLRTLLLLVGLAAVLPAQLNGSQLLTATTTLVFVLIFLSLSLLIGLSRQVSLTHAMFVVFGATTLSHLQEAGVPWLAALLLSGLVIIPVAALVAIPAIRLSGLFLALATFGFGILAQFLLFATPLVFGTESVVRISRPELFGVSLAEDKPFYYFVLLIVVLGGVTVETIRSGRMGRLLRALADSQTATESLGVSPMVSRVLVFCLSGFLAAIAGGLFGTMTLAVNPQSFGFFQSLLWVAVLVTSGASTLGGSVLAAVLLVAVPATLASETVIEYHPVFFGVAAMLLAQAPNGFVGFLRLPDFNGLAERSAWRRGRRRTLERLAS